MWVGKGKGFAPGLWLLGTVPRLESRLCAVKVRAPPWTKCGGRTRRVLLEQRWRAGSGAEANEVHLRAGKGRPWILQGAEPAGPGRMRSRWEGGGGPRMAGGAAGRVVAQCFQRGSGRVPPGVTQGRVGWASWGRGLASEEPAGRWGPCCPDRRQRRVQVPVALALWRSLRAGSEGQVGRSCRGRGPGLADPPRGR